MDEAVLVMEGGPDDGQTIPLDAPSTSIGRGTGNDVVVAEKPVSRSHAEIVGGAKGYLVRDVGSTNGTFVNGEKIGQQDHLLKDGDRIRLGAAEASLVFYCQTAVTQQMTVVTALHDVVDKQEADQLAKDEELYEGSARLVLKVSEGDMSLVLAFVKQIRDNPDCRILRMVNEPEGAVHIWMGIRRPVSLRQLLAKVGGVLNVSPTRGRDLSIKGADSPLTVVLSTDALASSPSSDWSPCVSCKELLEPGTTQCPRCQKTQPRK